MRPLGVCAIKTITSVLSVCQFETLSSLSNIWGKAKRLVYAPALMTGWKCLTVKKALAYFDRVIKDSHRKLCDTTQPSLAQGATIVSITTCRITAFSMSTLDIMTHSIIDLKIMTISIKPLCVSIKCHYAECHIFLLLC